MNGLAQATLTSCRRAAESDYRVALGKCANLADPPARESCRNQALTDLNDTRQTCEAQKDARLAACERLGPAPYDPVIVSDDLPVLHAHPSAVNVFWNPGRAGSQEFIYPLIAAVTGPILTFAPPAFFGAYSRNWPLPRSMARGPSPTLKIVFSPRRVIV